MRYECLLFKLPSVMFVVQPKQTETKNKKMRTLKTQRRLLMTRSLQFLKQKFHDKSGVAAGTVR